jgi:hypothetical protein
MSREEAIKLLRKAQKPSVSQYEELQIIGQVLALLESATKPVGKSEPLCCNCFICNAPQPRRRYIVCSECYVKQKQAAGKSEPEEYSEEWWKLVDSYLEKHKKEIDSLRAANKNLCEELTAAELEINAKDVIIEEFARHKHSCFMGEYNDIKIGKGCDCGLSKALKGQDETNNS